MEGKEVRFGIANSALFATVTTDASCGAVNSKHDSFTPLGGMVPLINIMLGEVVFGGVGSGLYGMVVFVILAVFIAGLMVGRTPEYLGKKIESYDVKMAMLSVLDHDLRDPGLLRYRGGQNLSALPASPIPGLTAFRRFSTPTLPPWATTAPPSAASTPTPCGTTPAARLPCCSGRFFMIIPVLAIAGNLAKKKIAPAIRRHFSRHRRSFLDLARLHHRDRRRPDIFPRAEPRARFWNTC